MGDFRLQKNQTESDNETAVSARFNFHTETVVRNVLKVLRGMTCTEKPILLEGTPGLITNSILFISFLQYELVITETSTGSSIMVLVQLTRALSAVTFKGVYHNLSLIVLPI